MEAHIFIYEIISLQLKHPLGPWALLCPGSWSGLRCFGAVMSAAGDLDMVRGWEKGNSVPVVSVLM